MFFKINTKFVKLYKKKKNNKTALTFSDTQHRLEIPPMKNCHSKQHGRRFKALVSRLLIVGFQKTI